MDKKFIYAGIPVVGLFFAIILPVISVSASAFGISVSEGAALFKLFDTGGNVLLGLVFLLVPLAVAYCAYVNKYMNYAVWVLLLPFVWLFIWKFSLASDMGGLTSVNIGAGAWIYLILSIAEIVLFLKPDLLDKLGSKKE